MLTQAEEVVLFTSLRQVDGGGCDSGGRTIHRPIETCGRVLLTSHWSPGFSQPVSRITCLRFTFVQTTDSDNVLTFLQYVSFRIHVSRRGVVVSWQLTAAKQETTQNGVFPFVIMKPLDLLKAMLGHLTVVFVATKQIFVTRCLNNNQPWLRRQNQVSQNIPRKLFGCSSFCA